MNAIFTQAPLRIGLRSYIDALLILVITAVSGCFSIPQDPTYRGPTPRPSALDAYYDRGRSYLSSERYPLRYEGSIPVDRISLESDVGEILIDYFKSDQENDALVLVFPVLGGKNIIADYFAWYMAQHGIDAAVILRDDTFKRPELVDDLEVLFRNNVIRDRIALDYFESELGKRQFGSFGISRGALNVAVTAGADARLKYNVLVMGGTDLPLLFRDSSQPRMARYLETVVDRKDISRDLLIEYLRATIVTDPKYLAQFMDARDTLLVLSMFDSTVPYKYGRRLRRQIGSPRMILIPANHFTIAAYTQMVPLLPPIYGYSLFPLDYIETEALAFYRAAFGIPNYSVQLGVLRVLQVPFDFIGGVFETLGGMNRHLPSDTEDLDEDQADLLLERPATTGSPQDPDSTGDASR